MACFQVAILTPSQHKYKLIIKFYNDVFGISLNRHLKQTAVNISILIMEAFTNIDLYNKIILFSKKIILNNNSKLNHIDLAHDLILSKDINYDNYMSELKSFFFTESRLQSSNISTDSIQFQWHGTKMSENVFENACKKCQESYPADFFRKRILKNGKVQIYYICKQCESIDSNIRRKKNDKKNELTTHQKYHLKKKKSDPEYLKKKVILMQEYRKRKKQENNQSKY